MERRTTVPPAKLYQVSRRVLDLLFFKDLGPAVSGMDGSSGLWILIEFSYGLSLVLVFLRTWILVWFFFRISGFKKRFSIGISFSGLRIFGSSLDLLSTFIVSIAKQK